LWGKEKKRHPKIVCESGRQPPYQAGLKTGCKRGEGRQKDSERRKEEHSEDEDKKKMGKIHAQRDIQRLNHLFVD
jgi:hypothetical protein